MLFGIGASLFAAGTLSGEQTDVQAKKRHYPLRFFAGGSAEFDAVLAAVYPRLAADPGFSALKSTAYLFKNEAPVGIRSLSLQWSVTTGASVFNYPMILELPARRHSIRSGQRLLMGPGGYLLVTPFFCWHPGAVPYAPIQWSKVVAGTATRTFIATEILASKAHGLRCHGIIYDNGVTVGSSTKHLAKHSLLTQAGEHDCALSIKKRLMKGQSLSEIEGLLKHYLSWHPDSPPTTEERIYQSSRRAHAAVLLRALNKRPDQFRDIVTNNVNQKRLRLAI